MLDRLRGFAVGALAVAVFAWFYHHETAMTPAPTFIPAPVPTALPCPEADEVKACDDVCGDADGVLLAESAGAWTCYCRPMGC